MNFNSARKPPAGNAISPDFGGRLKLAATGIKLGAAALALGYIATHCYYNVEAGHRAVLFSRLSGIQEHTKGEGTHFLVPWLERAEIFSCRVKPRTISSLTGTKDLQMVNLTIRVMSLPDPAKLPTIYRQLGKDYDDRVLPSIGNEVMKSIVAQFNASQLITQRERISALIKKNLTERARQFNILLNDVAINSIVFSPAFNEAVEAKQVAYQEVERAKFLVEKAQQDKLAIIAKADGEAQSAKMISDVIQSNPFYLELRRIEIARDIAHAMAKSDNKIILPSDNLLINMVALLHSGKDV